ncbi:hypothetical protein FRC00_011297 [Tulasnella sp. 408]|nr:hypothetical protein FRC00_011297 [Tulasnella sp. 408]
MASIRPVCRALATSRRLPARSYATQQTSWKESEFKPSADPQLNGYPDIPTSSYQLRPAKGWDDVQERRNIGEPVPAEYEALSMWTPDPPTHATPPSALRQFSIAVVGFLAFGVFTQMTTPAPVATPRDYPYEGLVVELGGIEQNKARPQSVEGNDE